MVVGGQRHVPAALPPGMNRYPLHRRLGGLQCQSGRASKISPPTGFDPRTVQPVASRYSVPPKNRQGNKIKKHYKECTENYFSRLKWIIKVSLPEISLKSLVGLLAWEGTESKGCSHVRDHENLWLNEVKGHRDSTFQKHVKTGP